MIGEDGLISYMRCGGCGREGRGARADTCTFCDVFFLPRACVAWSVLSPRLQKFRTDKRQVEL